MPDLSKILTPEERLLLSLCRLHFSEEQKRMVGRYMQEVTDWEKFVIMANEHGIIVLCWYNITETGNSNDISYEKLDEMHSAYLKSLARNSLLFHQVEEVATLAKSDKIKIVLLKGLALEKIIYGDKGLRQMNDIDILVRRKDAILLRNILLINGFDSQPFFSRLHEKILPPYGKHLPEMYKKGISVEIHFKLFEQKGNSLTEVFLDKSNTGAGDEINVYYPDPQLFFLYLVKHLDKHEKTGTSQLRLYADLIVMLSLYPDKIINEQLFNYASEADIEDALSEKFLLLESFWDIRFPDWIKSYTEKINFEITKDKFIRFLRYPVNNNYIEEPESLIKPIKEIPGIINKFLFIIGYVFPSLTFMKYRYSAKSKLTAVLYYPVRLGKLAQLTLTGKL